MRQVVGMPSLTVQFYLEGIGVVQEDAPLLDFSNKSISGAYVFTVDGIPVNADVDELTEEAVWMREDLSMSMQLLENMTAWVEGRSKGAACFYDYVVFSLLEQEDQQVELLSYFEGSPETRRIAHCKKVELFLGFDVATQLWEAYYTRLLQQLESRKAIGKQTHLSSHLQRNLDPGRWIVALAHWHKAIAVFKSNI
ncbi:MAG: hypothetical protein RLZZ519_121 [Bacteroidota bacterium]|jgi:hypothetical protein